MPPKITKGLEASYNLLYGTDQTLQCEASGGPDPVITWYKDGVLLVDTANIKVQGNTLQLKSVVESLSGEYKCIAKNRKAEAFSNTTVNVYCKLLLHAPTLTYTNTHTTEQNRNRISERIHMFHLDSSDLGLASLIKHVQK